MQIIAFISGKGGVGKSTLAANVAIGLSLRDKKVLVVDLDPQNVQRLHMGLEPDEIAGLVREGVSQNCVFESPFGVDFIPFGRVLNTELVEFEHKLQLNPAWVQQSIERLLTKRYDYILLDTPPGANVYLAQALHAAHRALVVLLPDAASFATVGKIMTLIGTYTANNPGFVSHYFLINQMRRQNKLGHQVRNALIAQYASQVVPVSVVKDVAITQALAFERPVLQYEPNCPASQSIQNVADWLIDSTNEA